MRVTLREAAAADLERIFEIERESFADPWPELAFRAFLGRDDTDFRVAEARGGTEGSEVVGYSVLVRAADEAELLNLAVAKSERGRGIGASLLDSALAAAVNAKVRALYLEVRESNGAARRLYESRGFTQVGRRRRYYRDPLEDALILQRREL